MCGRFALYTPPARIAELVGAVPGDGLDPQWRPRWNVAPTDDVLVVCERTTLEDGTRERSSSENARSSRIVEPMRWGLVAPWVGGRPGGGSFNARSESAATKPTFRDAFRHRRALVPADAFYEWAAVGRRKVPYAFRRADGEPLFLAALWQPGQRRHEPAVPVGTVPTGTVPTGPVPAAVARAQTQTIPTVAILTTVAGPDVAAVHDRQPVVLDPDAWDEWLDPARDDAVAVEHLLAPPPGGCLVHQVVGTAVGNVANDGPELLEPLEQGALPFAPAP